MRQQRVAGLQFIKHGVHDGLGHSQVSVDQRLLDVGGFHALGQLLVVVAFLAGQLADAARGQYLGVAALAHIVQLLVILFTDALRDGLKHLVERLAERLAVVVLQRLHHFLAGFLPRLLHGHFHVIAFHLFASFR